MNLVRLGAATVVARQVPTLTDGSGIATAATDAREDVR